jgi:hypothetical protein
MVTATHERPIETQQTTRLGRARLVDALVAIGLFVLALLYRRHFPPDGLFYDDAWQAFGAVHGTFKEFITVGQTQPGFGLELMVWSRVFGSGASSMVVPAMIAGAFGPPALYLVLRKFGYAVSVSLLLGAALTVCETAIRYSGHVKSYTTDVLVILSLCVLVPWLARQRWKVSTATAWTVGSLIVASFSAFALLATIAAAAIFVLHPRGDRKIRLVASGAQAVALAGILLVTDRTHNQALIVRFFDRKDAFIKRDLSPVSFGREIVKHFLRVTDVFPGGPGWFSAVCLVVATVGLFVMARSGSKAVLGRFLVLMVGLALAGAIARAVPFGPASSQARVTIWLSPIVAFGLAAVLQRAYRAAAARGRATRIGFDAVAVVCSALLLVSAVGARRTYPAAAALATRRMMAEVGPQDVVLITRPTVYTFALEANTPVQLQPTPGQEVGFMPRFADKRLHPLEWLTRATKREVGAALDNTNRAYVVDSLVDPNGMKQYRADLAKLIASHGFRLRSQSRTGTARISMWQREGTGSPSR